MTLFADIAQLEAEGRPFVLCTVIASHGSTPQKPGSRLVVLGDGSLRGTIGGGAIEKQVVDAALSLLGDDAAQTRTLETHLTHDLGMCCGGKMTVFLEKHGAPAQLFVFGAGHVAKELRQPRHPRRLPGDGGGRARRLAHRRALSPRHPAAGAA